MGLVKDARRLADPKRARKRAKIGDPKDKRSVIRISDFGALTRNKK